MDEGHQVTIIDRTGIAAGASQGNAGWIAHLDVLPLASTKAWKQVPRWLIDPLGPLAIRRSYAPNILPWLIRFLAACRPERVSASMTAIADLNRHALASWEALLVQLNLAGHLRRRGFLSIWDRTADLKAAEPVFRYQRDQGISVSVLTSAAVRDLEPAMGEKVVGGAYYEAGCHVSDPRQLTVALAEAAIQRGAQIHLHDVRTIASQEGGIILSYGNGSRETFDAVVIAAGAWSRQLAASLGDRIPLDTERGYNATFPSGALGLSRPVVFEGCGFVSTPLDTGDRIGGSVEFGGLNAAPNFKRIDVLLRRFQEFVPGAVLQGGRQWMGFRPSIPDSLPVISYATRDKRIVYAFGHGHYGLTQAAATARIVANLVARTSPDIDPRPFAAQRF
jgi:D-amino-acid dehydrogenase